MEKQKSDEQIDEEQKASDAQKIGESKPKQLTNPTAAFSLLAILLVIAIIVGTLPQLLKKSILPVTSPNLTQSESSNYSTEPGIFNYTLNTSNFNITIPVCNLTLISNNERDTYSYTITYDSPEFAGRTSMMTSEFSTSAEGYVRKVVTIMQLEQGASRIDLVMLLDNNLNCSKAFMNMTVNGQTFSQETACSKGSDRIEVCSENVNQVGQETITVQAGTFDTEIYLTNDNSTKYWISGLATVPIKIMAQNLTMELVNYKKWGQ